MTDPAGVFKSDTHRRVLGHLSVPDDDYGWTAEALVARMGPDRWTRFTSAQEIVPYLKELEDSGDATVIHRDAGHCWQMTPKGFERLTGEAVAPPPPKVEPAVIAAEPTSPKRRRWGRKR